MFESSYMVSKVNEIRRHICNQREEILLAFFAKYQCEPDEVEQVEETRPNGEKLWYVRKREPLTSCSEQKEDE